MWERDRGGEGEGEREREGEGEGERESGERERESGGEIGTIPEQYGAPTATLYMYLTAIITHTCTHSVHWELVLYQFMASTYVYIPRVKS